MSEPLDVTMVTQAPDGAVYAVDAFAHEIGKRTTVQIEISGALREVDATVRGVEVLDGGEMVRWHLAVEDPDGQLLRMLSTQRLDPYSMN